MPRPHMRLCGAVLAGLTLGASRPTPRPRTPRPRTPLEPVRLSTLQPPLEPALLSTLHPSAANMSQNQEQCSYKRVVLLFKLDYNDYNDVKIVYAFARHCGTPESEYAENKHCIHYDPGRHEYPAERYLAHIVIDFNLAHVESPDLLTLPHEIYKVKADSANQL